MFEIVKTNIFDKWLKKLKSQKTQAIIADHVARMTSGNLGVTRNVGEGVFEKKINYAGGGLDSITSLRKKHLLFFYVAVISRLNKRILIKQKK